MSYFLWFIVLMGLATMLGFLIIFVVFIVMVVIATIMAFVNTIRYKTWTEEGKRNYKRAHDL